MAPHRDARDTGMKASPGEDTRIPHPRTRTSVRHSWPKSVGDEIRKEIGQNSKQGQPGNARGSEHPCSAPFMMLGVAGWLRTTRDDWGPIFHVNPPQEGSWRKYIMRHACRASWRGQDNDGILPLFWAAGTEKLRLPEANKPSPAAGNTAGFSCVRSIN
jgi:hypothetical protein